MTVNSPPGPWALRLFCLCLVLLSHTITSAERLPIKFYTTTEGLAHNEVNRIVRDSRGFLWFCTGEGLSRYDGYTFANFGTDQGLPNPNVTDLLETHSGEYWVATSSGVVRFNPRGTPSNRVTYADAVNARASMFSVIVSDKHDRRSESITVLLEDHHGTIWFGTRNGLFQLDQTNQVKPKPIDIRIPDKYPMAATVSDLIEDRHGTLWIATPGGLYRRWPDGTSAHYTQDNGLPADYVQDLLEGHDGQIWVATLNGGFFGLVADESHNPPLVARTYRARDGLATEWIFQLFETAAHRFWIATNKGLVEFFPDRKPEQQFQVYTTRNGLSYQEVTALNEDLGGNLWLGTNTAGAMKMARNGFITYDEQDAVFNVNAIFSDRKGEVCFKGNVLGNEQTSAFEGARLDILQRVTPTLHVRFGCFDGVSFDWFKPKAISHPGWVMEDVTLQTRDGEWWLGSGEGVYRFPAADSLPQIKSARPLRVYTLKDGMGPQVFRLFEDANANIWISGFGGTANQLLRWERAGETLRDFASTPGLPSLKDNLPRSFGGDRNGNVWIGFNNSIARYSNGSFKLFTAEDGLPPGAIVNIYLDHLGRLWLASAHSGLIRIDDAESDRPTFTNYTTAQGLSSNASEVMVEDADGHIYVGGGNGLDRLDPLTGRIKHFTTADGLAPGLFRAAFRDHNGALWFGMTRGLSRFVPAPDEPGAPPSILITRLRVAGSPRIISALGEPEIALPDFSANENQLQLDFAGLNFVPGELLRYQHKLEGADDDWSAASELRMVNYASLAPGRYRFLVRAIDSDGHVSVMPATVTFTILHPVWQRWWFFSLIGCALSLMIYVLYRYRLKRLLEMANMRTRIATDLHDDIGANLTRISLLSEVAKQGLPDEPRDQSEGEEFAGDHEDHPLRSISRIARESVSSMSDIVWSINPEHDSLLDLTRKMRRHADEIFTLRDIELEFNAPGAQENQRVGVNIRRDLLLIFKEAVNNAARHSRCTRVIIDFRVTNSKLLLDIVDNGIGFDEDHEGEGHGLRSMKRRATALGGKLQINSRPQSQTSIRLSLPLARGRWFEGVRS